MKNTNEDLAVVVIIAHKSEISEQEKASLRQCYSILEKYPIRLICPRGLNIKCYKEIIPDAVIEFIDPKWQSTYEMFARLKISPLLYKKFSQFKFMLYYELDAWVFSDQLEHWCKAGYDYIGAPWLKKIENTVPEFYSVGGNGGFSLRNIKAHLHVAAKWKIMMKPKELWSYHKQFHNSVGMLLRLPVIFIRMLGFQNNSKYFVKKTAYGEDIFWCNWAPKIDPSFKVAPLETAQKFSFEKQPSYLYKKNSNTLPFGCHAWLRYEPEFWKQFIVLK